MIDQERDGMEIIDVREIDEFDLVKIRGLKLVSFGKLRLCSDRRCFFPL